MISSQATKLSAVASCALIWPALVVVACGSPEKEATENSSSQSEALRHRERFDALTRNYDDGRTGANLEEEDLDVTNVNKRNFGKLFELSVDDQVFAGIVLASDLRIARRRHDVVYVATMNNSIYAFDADE